MSSGLATDPRIGTEVAGYAIEALLGRGGMGVVYLARDPWLERRVALKLVAPELSADARFRQRFLRESKLAASLEHAHVVPIYEAGEHDGLLYLAMRYVEGTDLAAVLRDEYRLKPRRTLELVAPIAVALDAAHARRLVHRDVKPGSIRSISRWRTSRCLAFRMRIHKVRTSCRLPMDNGRSGP
jgi:serine/threonine-protein kinase